MAAAALRDVTRAIVALDQARQAARDMGNSKQEATAEWLLQSAMSARQQASPTIES